MQEKITYNNFKQRSSLKHLSSEDILKEFRATHNQIYLNELFSRYERLIHKLANGIYERNPHLGDKEDFIQTAYIGAQHAFENFDFSKDVKLITYLHKIIYNYILTTIDEGSFIRCPVQCRTARSYLSGKYDDNPSKKHRFEQSRKLFNDELKQKFKNKYGALRSSILDFESYQISEDSLIDNNYTSQSDIVSSVDMKNRVNLLTDREKMIYNLIFEDDESIAHSARVLGTKDSKLRVELNEMLSKLRNTFTLEEQKLYTVYK